MDERNPWRRLSRRIVYDNPWIRVFEDDVVTPAGTPSLYGVVSQRQRALGVLALEETGDVWLVGQWRYAPGRFSWECPEGGGRLDADPLEEARRELREETGLEAARWRRILHMHMSNSTSDEEALCWLATGLRQAAEPDLDDAEADLRVARTPFGDALRQALAGEITDAMTVAMLLRAHHMAATGELEPEIARAVLGGKEGQGR